MAGGKDGNAAALRKWREDKAREKAAARAAGEPDEEPYPHCLEDGDPVEGTEAEAVLTHASLQAELAAIDAEDQPPRQHEVSPEAAITGELADMLGYSNNVVTASPDRTRWAVEQAKRQEEVVSAEMAASTAMHLKLAKQKSAIERYKKQRIEARRRGLPPPPRPAILNDFISSAPDPLAVPLDKAGKSPVPPGWVVHYCSTRTVDNKDDANSVRAFQHDGYQEILIDGKEHRVGTLKAMMGPPEAYGTRMLQAASNPLMENDLLLGKVKDLDNMVEQYNSQAGRQAVQLYVTEKHNTREVVDRL